MIVTKTPLRVSLFGGGSDIESFYANEPGAVLSVTIDKYVRLAVQRVARPHIKLMYSEVEQVNAPEQLKHDRARECLKHFGITSNIEIASFADIPTKGTGLGSSSSFTVGLVQALSTYQGIHLSRYDVANLSCDIEIVKCGEKIGKQDQFAATYGGFNYMEFSRSGVDVATVNIDSRYLEMFADQLLCFYTGQVRSANTILQEQVSNLEQKNQDAFFRTREMVDMARTARAELQAGRLNNVGALLDDAWRIKKKMASMISNPTIDQMYEDARSAGALGGKILGAGGGGYLLLYVPFERQPDVMRKLKGFELFTFNFTDERSRVVYYDGN